MEMSGNMQSDDQEYHIMDADGGKQSKRWGFTMLWKIVLLVLGVIIFLIIAGIIGYHVRDGEVDSDKKALNNYLSQKNKWNVTDAPEVPQTTSTAGIPKGELKNCSMVCDYILDGRLSDNPVGLATSGKVAQIYPNFSDPDGVRVYCDCTDGVDEAWTVFQRRMDGTVEFYRNWADYTAGFGNLDGEFWLGLEIISNFSLSDEYEVRVDMKNWENETAYAAYKSFVLRGEATNFAIQVKDYSGNSSDSLSQHSWEQFSTWDGDHDSDSGNCAKSWEGAWWFHSCYNSHLNGRYYTKGAQPKIWRGIVWQHWTGSEYSLKHAEMKIRKSSVN